MADRVVHLAVPFEDKTMCGSRGSRTMELNKVTCEECKRLDEEDQAVRAEERRVENGQLDWSEGRRK